MSTPFLDIYPKFDNIFSQSELDEMLPEEKDSLIKLALPVFISSVKNLQIDYDLEEIEEDLNDIEITIICLYMYDEYLNKQLRRYGKLVNISSEIFKMTGNQDRVKNLQELKKDNNNKINTLLASFL